MPDQAEQRVCATKMWYDKLCGEPIHPAPPGVDPTPVCLMHSHDPNKSDTDFQAKFKSILKSAEEEGKKRREEGKERRKGKEEIIADFTRFVFPSANYESWVFNVKCTFEDATFTRKADFSRATFVFDARFPEAKFKNGADFRRATFKGVANFFQASFIPEPISPGMTDIDPSDVHLLSSGDFRWVAFKSDAFFSKATFQQVGTFHAAEFKRAARFVETRFVQIGDFTRGQFFGATEFRGTNFRQDAGRVPGPVFSWAEFHKPEAVVFFDCHLGQALFHNCDVSKFVFSSVEWRRRKDGGKRMVFEEIVDVSQTAPKPDDSPTTRLYHHLYQTFVKPLQPTAANANERTYPLIAELYQQLKKNYDGKKDYGTAGDFHYGEMEMRRQASPRKNLLARCLHHHLGLVAWYKHASHYGESYVRPAMLFLEVVLIFALLYPFAGLRYAPAKESRGHNGVPAAVVLKYSTPFWPGESTTNLYIAQLRLFGNSLVTALDIAAFQKEPIFEPVYPVGRLLTLLEMILTATLFGLFLLAVRRQFRR